MASTDTNRNDRQSRRGHWVFSPSVLFDISNCKLNFDVLFFLSLTHPLTVSKKEKQFYTLIILNGLYLCLLKSNLN